MVTGRILRFLRRKRRYYVSNLVTQKDFNISEARLDKTRKVKEEMATFAVS